MTRQRAEAAEESIARGLSALMKLEEQGGAFPAETSPFKDMRESFPVRNVFATAIVAGALAGTIHPLARAMREKASRYLLRQKSGNWTWNYWERSSKDTQEYPYPDDLDDTALAIAALVSADRSLVGGAGMAGMVRMLSSLEVRPGGPYRTWLVGRDAPRKWKDVDFAVNANVAFALSKLGITLEPLAAFLDERILGHAVRSPYYPSIYPPAYYASRVPGLSAAKELRVFLRRRLAREKEGLHLALGMSALLNLGEEVRKVQPFAARLLVLQRNGLWKAHAFCVDPSRSGRRFYGGSAAVTTALAIEALEKYRAAMEAKDIPAEVREKEAVRGRIIRRAGKRAALFPPELREGLRALMDRIIRQDVRGEIACLPFLWARSLRTGTVGSRLPQELGLASFWGWIAYTAYDDMMDGDAPPSRIPEANTAFREALGAFHDLSRKAGAKKLLRDYFDRIDAANAWELAHCRNPNRPPMPKAYDSLADRSLGHALGPMLIMMEAGYSGRSRYGKATERFFVAYLAARQLADDAHDWKEDLRKGQVNAAGAMLLSRARLRRKKQDDLENLFWRETIDAAGRAVFRHVARARRALEELDPVLDPAIGEALVARVEGGMREALNERDRTLEFLAAYGKGRSRPPRR